MSKKPLPSFTPGFTLIEVLVVITIIGLLSSVVFGTLNTARARSRDSQRVQTWMQFRDALELYAASGNPYPQGLAGNGCGGWVSASYLNENCDPLIIFAPLVEAGTISVIPSTGYPHPAYYATLTDDMDCIPADTDPLPLNDEDTIPDKPYIIIFKTETDIDFPIWKNESGINLLYNCITLD